MAQGEIIGDWCPEVWGDDDRRPYGAQVQFWGPSPAERSMLAQVALTTA